MRRRKKIATAAMISTTPIDTDMIVAVVGLCFGTRDRTQMVSTVAGTDPAAKSPATRQSTVGNAPMDRRQRQISKARQTAIWSDFESMPSCGLDPCTALRQADCPSWSDAVKWPAFFK